MTTTRLAKPEDVAQFTEWSRSTPRNGFDPTIAEYPTLRALTIEKDGEPLLYIPFHVALVTESAACQPGITAREYIEGLLQAKHSPKR